MGHDNKRLVCGNYVTPDDKVFQTGDTVMNTISLEWIVRYRPLPKDSATFV